MRADPFPGIRDFALQIPRIPGKRVDRACRRYRHGVILAEATATVGPAVSSDYKLLFRIFWIKRMCRNIKTLFNFDPPVTEDEVRAASLQFVRKISGFTKPSKANEAAFGAAVDEIAAVSARLLASLETTASPKSREEEAAKAKERALQRYGPSTLGS